MGELVMDRLRENLENLKMKNTLSILDKMVPWDDVRIRNWAAAIGPFTSDVIGRIFQSVKIKEQA